MSQSELITELTAAMAELSRVQSARDADWRDAVNSGDTTSWDYNDTWGDRIRTAESRLQKILNEYIDERIKVALEAKK